MRITLHKTLRQVAFHKAAKRDPNMETNQGDRHTEQLLALLDKEPSAEATVTFLDQLEHFLERLEPLTRQIIEMRLQGYSNDEICKELGIYDRKIRRAVERVRDLAGEEGLIDMLGLPPPE